MRDFNEKAFTPEEVELGLHLDLINHLLDYNKKATDYFYDIHITSDGYCTIVEWVDKSFNGDYDEQGFRHLNYDEVIMKEVRFPDNHIEYLFADEADEKLNEWIKENPDYKQNIFGIWYKDGGEQNGN